MNTLLLIDGNALIHRAYHALPDFSTKDGTPTNAVYGFAAMLYKVVQDFSPSHVLVCFDSKGPTFRDELFADYRAQRPETHADLISQFPLVREFLDSAGLQYIEQEGLEADDLIAVAAKKATKKNLSTIVLTGDRDIFQLVDDHVKVLTPQIGFAQGKLYDAHAVEEKFGVTPEHIPDHKALAGDPSDNYRGVAGIGPKTAAELINTYGSVEEIYKNIDTIANETIKNKLIADKENAILSKKLALLASDADVTIDLKTTKFNGYDEQLRGFFEKYQFRTLLKRYFENSKPEKREEVKKEEKEQLGLF